MKGHTLLYGRRYKANAWQDLNLHCRPLSIRGLPYHVICPVKLIPLLLLLDNALKLALKELETEKELEVLKENWSVYDSTSVLNVKFSQMIKVKMRKGKRSQSQLENGPVADW